jgi:hypothetical protein
MNLIVGIMVMLTGIMFLAYLPIFKKELKAKVESDTISPANAEKELKKVRLGGIAGSIIGAILILLEVTK